MAFSQPFSGIASPSWPFEGVFCPPCSLRCFFVRLASHRQWASCCRVQVEVSECVQGPRRWNLVTREDEWRCLLLLKRLIWITKPEECGMRVGETWSGLREHSQVCESWERGWYFPRLTQFFFQSDPTIAASSLIQECLCATSHFPLPNLAGMKEFAWYLLVWLGGGYFSEIRLDCHTVS